MTAWVKMTLRLPAQVHAALVEEMKETKTSLNQLIVDRLNASVGGVYVREEEANEGRILPRLDALEARLNAVERSLEAFGPVEVGNFSVQKEWLRDQFQMIKSSKGND